MLGGSWARAAEELEASLKPAVMTFAQRKLAGTRLLHSKQFAAAAAEYRGALDSMNDLVDKLPENEASPLIDKLKELRYDMESELVQATQAQMAESLGKKVVIATPQGISE